METLAKNWLTEGLIDFEYKKYILLAYLKKVHDKFSSTQLYPEFSELIEHFRNLKEIKESENKLNDSFKKPLDSIDTQNLKLNYKSPEEEEWFQEIKQIIEFSMPLMAKEVMQGKTIFDYVEKNIQREPLGILPINKNEGYFILSTPPEKEVFVYNYELSPISFVNQKAMSFKTNYVSSYTISLSMPIDKVKQDLIYQNPYLPNPAVYIFQSSIPLPTKETFLPVVKRLLFSQLTANKI